MNKHRIAAEREKVRNALVSVIIPTYNRPELLTQRAIPSVLAQTHRNLDLHVIGDGCTEETLNKMGDLAAVFKDSRVRFTNRPRPEYPPGLDGWHIAGSYAVNYGLDTTRGQYTCVIADDDEYLPTYVERCLDELVCQEVGAVYCASHVVGSGYLGVEFPPRFAQQSGGELLWRRNDFRLDVECWKKGLPNDWDFWVRMMKGGVRFGHVREVLYRYHPGTHRPPCHPRLPW